MKRPGHKDFNAVSHDRSRPEVLFLNLTWRSRGQISSVLLQLLLCIQQQEIWETREMICYVLAMGKQHLGRHVVVGYGIKFFWPGLFITSPDHLETKRNVKSGSVFKIMFSVHTKNKIRSFQIFRFEERFRNSPF